MEGLHNVVRTYMQIIDTHSMVSFLNSAVWTKTTKHAVILESLHNRILISPEFVYFTDILVTQL